MNSTLKTSLKSALVLALISIVAVVALSLANNFWKYEAKLDLNKVSVLNVMLPTGKSDQEAFEEGYFLMADVNIDAFNKAEGGAFDKVVAVYKAADIEGWEYSGSIIVETSNYGFSSNIILITSIKDGVINGLHVVSSSESNDSTYVDVYSSTNFPKVKEALIGKSVVTASDISSVVTTQSTTSINAGVKGIQLAIKMYSQVKEGA